LSFFYFHFPFLISINRVYALDLLNRVREDYNHTAEEFSQTRQKFWPEMEWIFDYIKPGDNVLDLGCANGRAFPYIQSKGGIYLGCDISENLLAIAQKAYPQASFRLFDGQSLGFAVDNYFDVIYAIAVFHNVPSTELRLALLRESCRALKPQGFFILTVWQPKDKRFMWLKWKNNLLKLLDLSKMGWNDLIEQWGKNSQRYYHLFSQAELKKMVSKAGFKIEKSGFVKNSQGNRNNLYIIAQKP